ncbi:MAG: methyltransferase domain-containing protein [Ilumatobacteraceae bacterium]
MLVTVLLTSRHRPAGFDPVRAELEEARRALAADGIDLEGRMLDVAEHGDTGAASQAVLEGCRAALAAGAAAVVTLDADGQHDPRQIPDLIRQHLARGSGLTIGSRWSRGGSSPGTGLGRMLLSRVGNAAVALVTGARGVRDSTTSFRVWSPQVAEMLLGEPLPAGTHGFWTAAVALTQAHGFAVDEVPIVFRPRVVGIGRLDRDDLREFAASLVPTRRRVQQIRRQMRSNQAVWAQRNPRLRAQAGGTGSLFGAVEELATLSSSDRFQSWIADSLLPHLGRRVLEVGAGEGAIATRLAAAGREVVAIEPAGNVFPRLVERVAAQPGVAARCITSQQLLTEGPEPFDAAVYVSVLEHILDDVAELRTAAQLVRPGGSIAVFVPAMPSLYGSLDFKSGHYRRYDRALLESAIREAGLEVEHMAYMDALGIVPYFVMYRLLDVQRLDSGSSALYDRVIVPVSRLLERLLGAPVRGKNLVAVARRAQA